MPLTPADVHNVAFSKPPIGKRGYHEDEVDAFLDLVEAELARLIEEKNDLRKQVEDLDRRLRAAPVSTGSNLRPLETPRPATAPAQQPSLQTSASIAHHAQTAKVLGLAQQIADRLTSEARAEADEMLSKARATANQLLSDAKAKADGMVNEARTRAETTLNDARIRAEALDRQAREKAAALERDAAHKHTEIIGSISQEKSFLEKRIDELRTFERAYHTRLKTYLESQLEALGEGGYTTSVDIPSQRDFAAHRLDSQSRHRSPNSEVSDEAGTSGVRWQPAVELDRVGVGNGMEPGASTQRSVS